MFPLLATEPHKQTQLFTEVIRSQQRTSVHISLPCVLNGGLLYESLHVHIIRFKTTHVLLPYWLPPFKQFSNRDCFAHMLPRGRYDNTGVVLCTFSSHTALAQGADGTDLNCVQSFCCQIIRLPWSTNLYFSWGFGFHWWQLTGGGFVVVFHYKCITRKWKIPFQSNLSFQ